MFKNLNKNIYILIGVVITIVGFSYIILKNPDFLSFLTKEPENYSAVLNPYLQDPYWSKYFGFNKKIAFLHYTEVLCRKVENIQNLDSNVEFWTQLKEDWKIRMNNLDLNQSTKYLYDLISNGLYNIDTELAIKQYQFTLLKIIIACEFDINNIDYSNNSEFINFINIVKKETPQLTYIYNNSDEEENEEILEYLQDVLQKLENSKNPKHIEVLHNLNQWDANRSFVHFFKDNYEEIKNLENSKAKLEETFSLLKKKIKLNNIVIETYQSNVNSTNITNDTETIIAENNVNSTNITNLPQNAIIVSNSYTEKNFPTKTTGLSTVSFIIVPVVGFVTLGISLYFTSGISLLD